MHPPRIDNRTQADLIEHMKEMVPYYTPEWRFSPDDPDPGTALFLMFADMFLKNVDRLNRVPQKNLVAFLNLLDVSQLSAKPAQTHVTFQINEGALEPVYVPQGTQVMAEDAEGGDPVLFETDSPVLLTTAQLQDLYFVSAKQDQISRVTERPTLALFEFVPGESLQEHAFYLGHRDLFLLKDTAAVEIDLYHSKARYKERTYGETLSNSEHVEWVYGTEEGWVPFDDVSAQGNRLVLKKTRPGEVIVQELFGKQNRWIACRIKPQQLAAVSPEDNELVLDGLRVRAHYLEADGKDGIVPEQLFFDDIELKAGGCYPFGEFFAPFSTFYLCDQEVFSKKGSLISLKFNLSCRRNRLAEDPPPNINWKLVMKESDFKQPPVLEASITSVLWEYWNGKAWVKLFEDGQYDEMFRDPSDSEQEIRFCCPAEIAEVYVNGSYNYWIRGRVLHVENVYAQNPIYLSPYLSDIRLDYRFIADSFPVEDGLTRNNLEWLDRTDVLTASAEKEPVLFAPFYPVDTKHPALYMGFHTPPRKGPIHVYFDIKQQRYAVEECPLFEWEYLRTNGACTEWALLKTIDETRGFTRSGAVQFAGPSDFAGKSLFQQELYWIRAVNRDDKLEGSSERQPRPVIEGIHLNTVAVTQQESQRNERPHKVVHEGGEEEFVLAKTPVYAEEVWVDETGHWSDYELKQLLMSDEDSVNVLRDSEGNVMKLWIKWTPVDNFDESGPDDRHYAINRSSGKFRFGNGKQGKVPPNSGPDKLVAHYKVTAGRRGNVAKGQIAALTKSIAFVSGVTNPAPAGGGCDVETLEEAQRRGPQMVRHRNKAVTPSDFEWLARQAHQDISKVKCFAGCNVNMERQSGCVTLVLLPKSGAAGLAFFPQLKQQVEASLLEKTAGTVAMAGNVQVIQPALLEISIYAHLVVTSIDLVVQTEIESLEKLDRFLDPLTGNYDGTGWDIGEQIHVSVFYALLKSTKGVNHVQKLSMTVMKIEDGERIELTPDQVARIEHGIVTGGRHTVIVDTL